MKKATCFFLAIILLLSGCGASVQKGDISFTVSHTYDYYKQAVELYNQSHETPVQIENFDLVVASTGMTSPSGNSVTSDEDGAEKSVRPWMDLKFENYEKMVQTGLLSGNGYDIIDMSGLDYEKYAEKGLLVNLDNLIAADPDFDWDEYDKSLIDRFRSDDGLFVLPISASTETIAVNADLFQELGIPLPKDSLTWEELLSMARQVSEAREAGKTEAYPFMKSVSYDKLSIEMFDRMLRSELYTIWIDRKEKTHRFDTKEFLQTLEMFQQFDDPGLCSPNTEIGAGDYQKTLTDRAFVNLELLTYENSYEKQFLRDWEFLGEPCLAKQGQVSSPLYARYYAISKDSPYIEESWEFLKALISPEMQSIIGKMGMESTYYDFPIHLSSRAALREEQLALSVQNEAPMTTEDAAQIDALLANAMPDPQGDNKLRQAVLLEAEKFFLGQKTAEQAVEQICERVELYLHE